MPAKRKPYLGLLITVGILTLFGLFMIASAGAVLSQEKFGESFYFVKNQILKGLLPGLILGFFAYLIPYPYWRKYAKYIFLICLAAMIMVFIPHLGLAAGGAKRWVKLGPIVFQPSEFLKIGFLIYLAAFLEKKGGLIKNIKHGLLSFIVVLAILGVLIGLQPDIGTLGVFVLTALAMYFTAQAPISHLIILSGLGFSSLLLFVKMFPHAMRRMQVFLAPELDPKGIGYQIDQSLIALGNGGIFGQGLTESRQKFFYLPEPAGDSIAAVIGEELGFVGLIILIFLFCLFAYFGLKIARNAPDKFSELLAAGLTCLIVIQALINILAIVGLIPLTGLTLPFISYGGSSLLTSLVATGILLNISKFAKI